jgi:hypothetical protein
MHFNGLRQVVWRGAGVSVLSPSSKSAVVAEKHVGGCSETYTPHQRHTASRHHRFADRPE